MCGAVRFRFAAGVVCAFLGVGLFGDAARGEVIVGYESTNPEGDVAASEVASGVNALALTRGPGVSRSGGTTFNTRGWSTQDALDPDDYLQWGWESSTTRFDLDTLDVRYDRSSSGPSQLEVHLAVNGGGFESIFCDKEVDASGETLQGIDLGAYDSVESAIFRLYGYDSSRTSGTFDLENFATDPNRAIVVHGTASSVPEPSTVGLLLSLGVGAIGLTRKRQRML